VTETVIILAGIAAFYTGDSLNKHGADPAHVITFAAAVILIVVALIIRAFRGEDD
jgi:preprotein translocase subunit Sec61beta